VCNALGGEIFNWKEMMDMSRHCCRHTPETPEGFWDMSFADEKEDHGNLSD